MPPQSSPSAAESHQKDRVADSLQTGKRIKVKICCSSNNEQVDLIFLLDYAGFKIVIFIKFYFKTQY